MVDPTIIRNLFGGKENLVIFDIGAANFADSITFKAHFPLSRVYSFEPDKDNIVNIEQIRKQHNISIFPIALSDEDGTTRFFSSEELNGQFWKFSGSILKPKVKEGTKEGFYHNGLTFNMDGYEVETSRLDTFCKANEVDVIDYMHLDVQGAETKVIKGMGKIRPAAIFAETCEYDTYETNTNLQEFDALMASYGYSIKKRFQYDTLYIHESIQ
jgi:FkbM family methyltransferase